MDESKPASRIFFVTSKRDIGHHTPKMLIDNELYAYSVVKNYFTTDAEGKAYKTILNRGTNRNPEWILSSSKTNANK